MFADDQSVASPEVYDNAMNFIGESLLAALNQSLEKLPANCRKTQVVSHGLAAFLANVIYKQFPKDRALGLQMLKDLTSVVGMQLEQIPED